MTDSIIVQKRIEMFRTKNSLEGVCKQIWFLNRNESFEENEYYSSESILNIVNSQWSLQTKNIYNIKRSLLRLYKDFEYNHYQKGVYSDILRETQEGQTEVTKVVNKILESNGIGMLLYESSVPDIYLQISSITGKYFCSLFKAKLFSCSKLTLSVNQSDTNQIDEMLQDEIEQSFLQQQIIEILSENGIHLKQISFHCVEKIQKNDNTQYVFYFDIIDREIYEQISTQIVMTFGRRLFNSVPLIQENIQYNIVNIAIFETSYFTGAIRQSPLSYTNLIVFRISGIWSDNIDDIEIAKEDELFLDYCKLSSQEDVNSLQVAVRQKQDNNLNGESIIFNEKEYDFYIKVAMKDKNQFKYFATNQSQNLIDLRCIQSQMMQVILLEKHIRQIYELDDISMNGESTVGRNQSELEVSTTHNRQMHLVNILNNINLSNQQQADNIQVNVQTQPKLQTINKNNYFMQNPNIGVKMNQIAKIFGLQDFKTIVFNFQVRPTLNESELMDYYQNKKVFKFQEPNKVQLKELKESIYIFYQAFSYLPMISKEDLITELRQKEADAIREFTNQQSQNANRSRLKAPKERRIKQINLIEEYCSSKNKKLFFIKDFEEIKPIIESSDSYLMYKQLTKEEYTLVQNIFIHFMSIYRCGDMFRCSKIVLTGFNNALPDQVSQQEIQELTLERLALRKEDLRIYRFKYIQEKDECHVYFEILTEDKQKLKHIDELEREQVVKKDISLFGGKLIIPVKYLKSQKNDVINLKPEDQSRFTLTYYYNPVQYQFTTGMKLVYGQIIGEKHEGKLDNLKRNETRIDQCITFMEKESFLNGNTSYIRDLIQHLNKHEKRIKQNKFYANHHMYRSVVVANNINLTLDDKKLLHNTQIAGQMKLKGYYIKPIIKDVERSFKYYEFNSNDVYDQDWWLTGWPILYRSVFDYGDQNGNFIFSDNPYLLLSEKKEKQLQYIQYQTNPNVFYICSIDPRFDNFQLIESNHIAKIPFYYCRTRCIIIQRDTNCSIF